MPHRASADTHPATVREFCLRILRAGDLATKLAPPFGEDGAPLPDSPSGPACTIERPEREPGLRMGPGGAPLPSAGHLEDPAERRACLARFAHHELQAVELFAWALLRWPEAPEGLRRGLLSALADEQRHCRLYLDRLAALGGHFETDDHSDYFWQQAPAIAAAPDGLDAFLAAMGLTLEQANLDFTLTYRDAFAASGDAESAAVCQEVHDDEIAHVALANRWLSRIAGERELAEDPRSDLERYLDAVPFPLGPTRAKGRRFDPEPRRRAGLSEAMIEHVRLAKNGGRSADPLVLIPNLGAEEGDDGRAYREHPPARTAAHLWSLLFPRHAVLRVDPRPIAQSTLWPPTLGRAPSEPVFDFLDDAAGAHAWLNTEQAIQAAEGGLAGPAPEIAQTLNDKAFAVRTAEELGLVPRAFARLVEVIEPSELLDPGEFLPRLETQLRNWPAWTAGRFTLKPRHGSSGRGRIGGTARDLDVAQVRGALPRLAARGGAILEPWLDRTGDFSTSLHVPSTDDSSSPLLVLGSLEMAASASGGYRGHFGEVDSRGRVFSGDRDDERLRADAAALAARARAEGLHGPCGVDAFRYREPSEGDTPVDRLRVAVELNARPTMGLVAIGLVRRALPRAKKKLGLEPGERHGFALTYRNHDDEGWRARIYEALGQGVLVLDLAAASQPGDPCASLVFAREPEALRRARRRAFGC